MSMFLDTAKISVRAGKGGDGMVAFRREKYVPNGGPWGGDGGKGGSVVFRVDEGLRTLMDFRYNRKFRAKDGEKGMSKGMHGRGSEDLIVRVPQGTTVRDAETGKIITDLVENGQEFVIARGGRGGRGNIRFATPRNPAPEISENGEPGEERQLELELKVLADVGLVGFPSAGKSSLVSAISAAKPKIADYPFTTLHPNLGVVQAGDVRFTVADVPGLIEGASEGKGLGLRFLRHIERNSLLLFMVPGDTDDIKKEYEVLLGELKNFNPEMLDKHRVLAITKCDLLDEELIEMLKETLPTDLPVVFISSVTGQGIQELKDVLWKELNSESNKLQEITAEDTLVHRDKDMSRFQQELAAEGEDVVEYIDEDEIEDVDDLDDFEYE